MSGGVATAGGAGVDEIVVSVLTRPGAGRDRDGDLYGGGGWRRGQRCVGGGGGEEWIGRVIENRDGNWDIKYT